MRTSSNHYRTRWVYVVLVLSALGCGGRVTDASTDDTDVPGGGTDTSAPACSAICRHVVDSCFPGGGIEPCVRSCESTRVDYAGCRSLTPFLRCNLTARVVCTDEAVIDDCYGERNELVRCKS
jgi:hypothetical protein